MYKCTYLYVYNMYARKLNRKRDSTSAVAEGVVTVRLYTRPRRVAATAAGGSGETRRGFDCVSVICLFLLYYYSLFNPHIIILIIDARYAADVGACVCTMSVGRRTSIVVHENTHTRAHTHALKHTHTLTTLLRFD